MSTQNLHKHYWLCCLFRTSWKFAEHRLLPGQCQAAAVRNDCKPAENGYVHYRNQIVTIGGAAYANQWGFLLITASLLCEYGSTILRASTLTSFQVSNEGCREVDTC